MAERLRRVEGAATLVLTHRGRKSGKPYDVTIWFVVDDDAVLLPSANVNTNWPRNVRANPAVTLKIASQTFHGMTIEVTDAAERERTLAMAMRKYWYAAPFLWLARALISYGVLADRSVSFRVKLSD
ncbi:MAG TPA: nitroreductase family deazaflavin-dependent oxidoreductase [Candidatus Acidoferrales bacterium]|nr:nitroreductase family deazaflavin-dependent oxidoreductase [Candidatus Acidoferrales bacterium]